MNNCGMHPKPARQISNHRLALLRDLRLELGMCYLRFDILDFLILED